MTAYLFRAKGCDETTRVVLDLTDDEAATARRIADAITAASDYSCEPRLYVVPVSEVDEDELPEEADQ
ncbi:hypothetical protein ACIRPH_30835 [Nocardiopsis sp. NPDC101807]|uniref:hypothetical protein n=1 Tax=Nocardiopsis sp. NPDC101807 TaxID=3364339 RepID=UPI003826571E